MSSLLESEYEAEIRFGVVMYGGVSLAIYINGVSDELYQMACATPRAGYKLRREGEPGTREIYRRLSWLVGNAALRRQFAAALAARVSPGDVWHADWAAGQPRTRLVVDTIAGTSAGGINGVFLAKALANGEEFAPLRQMWIDEGDIGLLLNDKRSYAHLDVEPPPGPPKSLLNSDRMYLKLRNAMRAMGPIPVVELPAGAQEGESPLADRVDLFVTTTDIRGAPVPLRLFDRVVYEHRYKHSFHFAYPEGEMTTQRGDGIRNDFALGNEAFLAFAARCTSSFPFAFEPMMLANLTRLEQSTPESLRRWDAFFSALPSAEVAQGAHAYRAFGDGGYLDNKPFSYVVKSLAEHFADVPVQRKLVYIEPSPEELSGSQIPSAADPPDAIANAAAALTTIPWAEAIREDLQDVLGRNRRIERIERIVQETEPEVEKPDDPFAGVVVKGGKVRDWAELTQADILKYYGLAFIAYRRLRIEAATDQIGYALGRRWDIDPHSDAQYAVRALVRHWRERHFDEEGSAGKGTINAFLEQYDHAYRVRRYGLLMRKVDQLTNLFRLQRSGVLGGGQAPRGALSKSDEVMLGGLKKAAKSASEIDFDLRDGKPSEATIEGALAALRALKRGLRSARDNLLRVDRAILDAARESDRAPGGPWQSMQDDLRDVVRLLLGETDGRSDGEVVERSSIGLTLVDGTRREFALDAEAMRGARRARVLQEAVMLRTDALAGAVTAAAAASPTRLHKSVDDTLHRLRILRHDDANATGVQKDVRDAIAATWLLLGRPKLVPEALPEGVAEGMSRRVTLDVRASEPRNAKGEAWADLATPLNTPIGESLRRFIAQYYERFDSFDQMSFPMYYDTDTGEPAVVDVVRISPVDATSLLDDATAPPERRKLAGAAFHNFAAFFDTRFRVNDIMWGRLDGAERLVFAVLPGLDSDSVAVRQELTRLAQVAILRETLVKRGGRELTALLCEAMQQVDGPDLGARLHKLIADMNVGPATVHEPLLEVLSTLLDEQGLLDYVGKERRVNRQADPKQSFDNLARATTITGRMLEGIAKERNVGRTPARWVARIGLILQGMVAVSLPGTLRQRWWAHGLKVLYAFEALGFVFAFFFGSGDARSLFAIALMVTFVVHMATLIIGDAMNRVFIRARMPIALLGIVAVALAVAGGIGLARLGPYPLLCGAAAPASVPGPATPTPSPSLACRLAASAGASP